MAVEAAAAPLTLTIPSRAMVVAAPVVAAPQPEARVARLAASVAHLAEGAICAAELTLELKETKASLAVQQVLRREAEAKCAKALETANDFLGNRGLNQYALNVAQTIHSKRIEKALKARGVARGAGEQLYEESTIVPRRAILSGELCALWVRVHPQAPFTLYNEWDVSHRTALTVGAENKWYRVGEQPPRRVAI